MEGNAHEELLGWVSSLRSVGAQHCTGRRIQQHRQSHHQQSLSGICLEIPMVVDVRGSVARGADAQLQVSDEEGGALSSYAPKKAEQVQLFQGADEPVAHSR